jgi:hypothetical protein
MSLLVRRLSTPRNPTKGAQLPWPDGEPVPLWALREFIPSPRDKDSLSLYEIQSEEEIEEIAGAFHFTGMGAEAQTFFLGAETGSLAAAGFEIKSTRGTLHHSEVDGKHREVRIETFRCSANLTRLFLTGLFYTIQKAQAEKAWRKSVDLNLFDYPRLIAGGNDNHSAKNLLSLIRDNTLLVMPPASPPGRT